MNKKVFPFYKLLRVLVCKSGIFNSIKQAKILMWLRREFNKR
jgi:hypothetical protein